MNDVASCPDAGRVPPKGITRYDHARAHGWLARVYRTEDGESTCLRHLFSDRVHGGREAALDAAIAWRRAVLVPRTSKRIAGYGYVRRALRTYRTATGELRSYEAFEANVWDYEGKQSSTAWSIERHGEERAKAECEAWLAGKRLSMSVPLGLCG